MKSILKMALACVGLVAIGQSAGAFSETSLKNQLQDIAAAYGWECSGEPCRGVWNEQIRSNQFASEYVDNNLTQNLKLQAATGQLAKRVAYKICGSSANADYDTLLRLVTSENRVLRRLTLIQDRAGIPASGIKTCDRVIR